MSVRIFGIKKDGRRDLIGMAPGAEKLLLFAHGLNEALADYQEAFVADDEIMSDGLLIWTVYNHPKDWPDWYVARLFINETPRGNLLLYRDLDELRKELQRRGLTRLERMPADDPIIMETWL